MEDILTYMDLMFGTVAEMLRGDVLDEATPYQHGIIKFAALSEKKPDAALLDIYLNEMYVQTELNLIVGNIFTGDRDKFWADKETDDHFTRNYNLNFCADYTAKYANNALKIHYDLTKTFLSTMFLSMVNSMICDVYEIWRDLGYTDKSDFDERSLKQVLEDMTEHYISQIIEFKPIKEIVNNAWKYTGIKEADYGFKGAVIGSVFGGPAGLLAGAILGRMIAEDENNCTQ